MSPISPNVTSAPSDTVSVPPNSSELRATKAITDAANAARANRPTTNQRPPNVLRGRLPDASSSSRARPASSQSPATNRESLSILSVLEFYERHPSTSDDQPVNRTNVRASRFSLPENDFKRLSGSLTSGSDFGSISEIPLSRFSSLSSDGCSIQTRRPGTAVSSADSISCCSDLLSISSAEPIELKTATMVRIIKPNQSPTFKTLDSKKDHQEITKPTSSPSPGLSSTGPVLLKRITGQFISKMNKVGEDFKTGLNSARRRLLQRRQASDLENSTSI